MKKNGSTILLVIILVIGLSLLLYPSFANYWNSFTQSRAIATYMEQLATIDTDAYAHLWEEAEAYNKTLLEKKNPYLVTSEEEALYNSLLNVDGSGVMGYVEIPNINVSLPVYHGTSDEVLQVAIGHLDWTSLPTGGESTHCAISGHRGLPSAKLFTDLDQVSVGDYFVMNILDRVMTYEVDQIHIVEPKEVEGLLIQEGKDLCTLITCTPYGINSHRLLVRGHRVENLDSAQVVRVTADAFVIEKLVVAPFILMPILLVMFIALMVTTGKKEDRRNQK